MRSYFSSGTRLSHLILWTGDLVLERVFALLVLLPVVSKCAFESVLRVLHQAACCTSWLTGVTKGCPQRGTTLRCSLTTMCITSQSLQSVPECSMVYHVYHSERLHAVRQHMPEGASRVGHIQCCGSHCKCSLQQGHLP